MPSHYDITVLTNLPVDRLYTDVSPATLNHFQLTPSDFNPVTPATFQAIRQHLGEGTLHSGGAGANTGWAMAKLGHRVALVGHVGNDPEGRFFHGSMADAGVHMAPPQPGLRTMEIKVLIDTEGHRTFASDSHTPLITPGQIPENFLTHTKLLWLDPYLLESREQHPAIHHALATARENNALIGASLSSPWIVQQHGAFLCQLIRDGLNLLACNETEMAALQNAIRQLPLHLAHKTHAALNATNRLVTHGAKGAEYLPAAFPGLSMFEETPPVPKVVDTTGAGDAFLAGFLHKYLSGAPIRECLQSGHALASHVVQHVGARLPRITPTLLEPPTSRAHA